MIYTGTQFRRIQERSQLSFLGEFVLDNSTGHAAFGFSGDGNYLKFDFKSGKIYDPEGRYVYSYEPAKIFSISGSYKTGTYNYAIDNTPICTSGLTNDFNIERFFGAATGCTLQTSGFQVNASGEGDVQLTGVPSTFDAGELKIIKVINTGYGKALDVFSGQFVDFETGASNVNNIFTVEQKPSGLERLATGNLGVRISSFTGISGIANNATYDLQVKLYTSAGPMEKDFRISGLNIDREIFFNASTSLENFINSGSGIQSGKVVSGGSYNVEKTGAILLHYSYYSGGIYPTGLPLQYSLKYVSGTTGLITGMVTGVTTTSSGSGFLTTPLIQIAGGGGAGAVVSGTVLGGSLSGISLLNAGANYTSAPTVTIFNSVQQINIISGGSGYLFPPKILISGGGGAFASGSGVVSPSGHSGELVAVTLPSYGSGFTGIPSVTLPTTCVGGVVLEGGGSGYTGYPLVTFVGGGGAGASGVGTVGSQITGVEITSSGKYYNSTPSIIFTTGTYVEKSVGGNGAAGNALMTFSVTGASLTYSGSGYACSPTVWFTGNTNSQFSSVTQASGIGLTGNPNGSNSGYLTGIRITATGGFYTGVPNTFISGCGAALTGSGVARLGSGFLTGVKIINKGNNYTGIPFMMVSGGLHAYPPYFLEEAASNVINFSGILSGSGTPLTGNPTGQVLAIKMFSGSGHSNHSYTSTPSVLFSSRGQSAAASGYAFLGTGAQVEVIMSEGATATAVTGSYIKSFTGTWNLLTGSGILGNERYNYRSGNKIDAQKTGYIDSIHYTKSGEYYSAGILNKNLYDDYPMVVKFAISGQGEYGQNYYTKFITGVR